MHPLTIQYNKQFILHWISDKIVTQTCITSLKHLSIYNMYAFVNKHVFNLVVKTARKVAVLWWQVEHYTAWVLPSEMTCHLHILVMSEGTCNRCWSLHLNCLGTIFWDRNWVRYNGVMLWRSLYVKHYTLNSICLLYGLNMFHSEIKNNIIKSRLWMLHNRSAI